MSSPYATSSAATSGPEPLDHASRNKRLLLAGQAAFFPTGILQTILGPLLPILIVRWAINDTQAGNLFLVQFLASLVSVQLTAVLLSRFGYRPAFLSGLLLMATGAAMLYSASPWMGLVAVAANGLGLGFIVPSDNLLIAEISADSNSDPGARAAAVSFLNFCWGVGAVLCSLLVAWSAAHHALSIFLGAAAILLVFLALAMWNLPFPPAAKLEERTFLWRSVLKSRAVWLFATVFFLYPGAETAIGGWIGSYVARIGARGAMMASVMPAFFYAALTAGRAMGSVFLRHFSEMRVLRLGFALGATGIGLMVAVPSLPMVIGGALITGLSFATIYPIIVARFSERFGVMARSIGAIMFSLASLGPAMIPWAVGATSHVTGSLRIGLMVPLTATAILFVMHIFEW